VTFAGDQRGGESRQLQVLAVIEDAIAVEVVAVSGSKVALVGSSVAVAVRAGLLGDVVGVGDAVVVAVREFALVG
jgi:hypothetical protein